MLIKKIKAIAKWTLLLLVVFCLSFLAAGGGNFILPDRKMPVGVQDTVHDAVGSLRENISKNIAAVTGGLEVNDGSGSHASAAPPSAFDRISRMIFLKEAVNARVSQPDYVKLQYIPEAMQQAVIAVEDRKFYSHWGFDMEGIFRASLVNMQYGEVREGASTITQQLVKNLFLSQEQTMGRKAEEFLLAMDMEINYSKAEILELYLNSIYFGSGYYGIGQAARGYFGKEPAMLTLPEAAMLAGIPNAPSLYSPYVDFMLAKKRQFIVLDAMTAAGFLRKDVADDAKIRPIELAR